MCTRLLRLIVATLAVLVPVSAGAAPVNVFSDTFNGGAIAGGNAAPGVAATFTGIWSTEAVSANLFNLGWGFQGDMARNASGGNPAVKSTLTLTGLGAHDSVSVYFLLAILDSWDAIGCCSPDFFNVMVGDGVTQSMVFSQTFDNYNGGAGQTFNTSPSARGSFGANAGWQDAAYVMNGITGLTNIVHTSSTLQIDFFASGPGWQGGNDESWAIDELKISMNSTAVPEPATLSLLGVGLAALARRRFRRSA